MAPHKERLMTVAAGGRTPNAPKIASAAVIGTTSATVIQSRPSMKLTRLTNHSPPMVSRKPLEPKRHERCDPQFMRQSENDQRHAEGLQKKARRDTDRTDVVGGADRRR